MQSVSDVQVSEFESYDNNSGVSIRGGCSDITLQRRRIFGNSTHGVYLDSYSDYEGHSNLVFYYNLIYNPNGLCFYERHRINKFSIFNTVFYENQGENDLSFSGNISGAQVRNSIYQNASGDFEASSNFDSSSDPLFVNPDEGDFGLRSGSLCIDKGEDVGLDEDFVGTPVPSGDYPDIGAFEFVP
jgi:hypothetical protein